MWYGKELKTYYYSYNGNYSYCGFLYFTVVYSCKQEYDKRNENSGDE